MTQIIQNSNGGGGSGGGGDMKKSVYDPDNINSNAFDYDNFINTPTIPTDTSELTNGAGYITGIDSGDVTAALGYTPYNSSNPDGFISGITSGDVTTALGYTPYNSSNPSGYISGITSGDVTTALGYTPADSASLGTAATKNTGTSSGNVPVLDSNGKLATTTLPGVALTDTFTVTNKSDLTSLSSAEQGDIGIVTSESKTYVLSADPYSTASNWKELLTPTDAVTSVNGQTGAVTLDADDISDSTTTNKFVTASEKTTWNNKQNALSTQTAYTTKGTATKVPTISTNTLGQVTAITETSISFPVTSVNGQTGAVSLTIPTISTISVTLTTAGWSSSTQSVTATGVTASNTVICSPAPSSISDYSDNGVYCSAQGTNSLTFTCDSTPSNDITVNVVILN